MGQGLRLNNKTLITSIMVFIIACVAGYNFIYKSNIEKAGKLKQKIEEAKKIKVLLQNVKILDDKVSVYSGMKNDSPEPSSFLSKVVDIATGCEIKTDEIRAGNVIIDGPYKFLPCGISFTAPYRKFKQFIGRLETDKMYIKIERLSIVPNAPQADAKAPGGMLKNKNEGVLVTVNMELLGFYAD
jgi:Tfp pilus assembly protein PilO